MRVFFPLLPGFFSSWWQLVATLIVPLLPSLVLYFAFSYGGQGIIDSTRIQQALELERLIGVEKSKLEDIRRRKEDLRGEIEQMGEQLKDFNQRTRKMLEANLEMIRRRRKTEEEISQNEFVKEEDGIEEGEVFYLFGNNFEAMMKRGGLSLKDENLRTKKKNGYGIWLVLFCGNECHRFVPRYHVLAQDLSYVLKVGLADSSIDPFTALHLSPSSSSSATTLVLALLYNGSPLAISQTAVETLSAWDVLKWLNQTLSS